MAKPHVEDPDIETLEEEDVEERTDLPWKVILFNDDVHTFEEVVIQLMRATGCSEQRAWKHAETVHTQGKDCVFSGVFDECFRVQSVLREIQLITQIEG